MIKKRLAEYLKIKWYKGNSDAGWYDTHKSKENIYNGYWSFETAAIVKILGLDAEKLAGVEYYRKIYIYNVKTVLGNGSIQ